MSLSLNAISEAKGLYPAQKLNLSDKTSICPQYSFALQVSTLHIINIKIYC